MWVIAECSLLPPVPPWDTQQVGPLAQVWRCAPSRLSSQCQGHRASAMPQGCQLLTPLPQVAGSQQGHRSKAGLTGRAAHGVCMEWAAAGRLSRK